jgi:integrase
VWFANILGFAGQRLACRRRSSRSTRARELGRLLHPNILTDAFRRLCERLDLKYRLHDMRHSAASFMLKAGRDLKAVQRILGHSAASTTLDIYGHALDGATTDAVRVLDRLLRRKASGE